MKTSVGQRNNVLSGDPDPPSKEQFWGFSGPLKYIRPRTQQRLQQHRAADLHAGESTSQVRLRNGLVEWGDRTVESRTIETHSNSKIFDYSYTQCTIYLWKLLLDLSFSQMAGDWMMGRNRLQLHDSLTGVTGYVVWLIDWLIFNTTHNKRTCKQWK